MQLTDRVSEYKLLKISKEGTTNSAEDQFNNVPFITVRMKNITQKGLSGRVQPFLTITAFDQTSEDRLNAIKKSADDEGLIDEAKLEKHLGDSTVRGIFGRWQVTPHWQTYRGDDGKLKFRKYREGHSDAGYKMPSRSVTMFVWEDDLEDIDSILNSVVPAGTEIKFDDEHIQNHSYASATAASIAQDVLKRAKADNSAEEEEEASATSADDDDVVNG